MFKYQDILNEAVKLTQAPVDTTDYIVLVATVMAGGSTENYSVAKKKLRQLMNTDNKLRNYLQTIYKTQKCYRGINISKHAYKKHFHLAEQGDTVSLQSYNKQTVFSWTIDKGVADVVATSSTGGDTIAIIVEAIISKDMILFDATKINKNDFVEKLSDMEYADQIRYEIVDAPDVFWGQKEIIVHHKKPIKATVIFAQPSSDISFDTYYKHRSKYSWGDLY